MHLDDIKYSGKLVSKFILSIDSETGDIMLLKELTELNGVSGDEREVREFIKTNAKDYSDDIKVDSMGNLICVKKGNNAKHKLMISAHMDEVGFMVTGYGEGGVLKFATVGGIDSRILLGKRLIVGDKKLGGIIGGKPIHLQSATERQNNVNMKNMYIDIGADSKEEAEKLVSIGEYAAFYSNYSNLGKNVIKAKALDDRVGCAILLDILREERYNNFDLYACFTVQEEVGLRGAEVVSYDIDPDIALVIEGTTCSDVLDVEDYEQSTILGEGAALTIMDRGAYSNKKLVEFLYKMAKITIYQYNIKQLQEEMMQERYKQQREGCCSFNFRSMQIYTFTCVFNE